MQAQSPLPNLPTPIGCYRKLAQMEAEWEVKLRIFVNVKADNDGSGYFELLVSGSGDIFDRIPFGHGEARSRLSGVFTDCFSSSLWYCLHHLEAVFCRYP